MKIIGKYIDDQYPNTGITHTRKTVRAIVMNEDGNIALHHLLRDDKFGHRDYFETPGGGVDKGETLLEALRRELKEELGVTVKDIIPLGRVIDYYNLLNQRNSIYYYFCKVDSYGEKNFQGSESTLIESTKWVSLSKAKELYENMTKEPLENLVRQRELPVIELVISTNIPK